MPEHLGEPGEIAPELLVGVHGTGRGNVQYRDAFSEFGRFNDCVVLAPLFPVGVLGDENRNGYKYIQEGDIRYDEVLLAMVSEVEERLGLCFPRFMMFGYSGGGHFVHRFAYLHPERVSALCIGAAGSVTLLDDRRDWWVGIRDVKARFGKEVDREALRRMKVMAIVGAADVETWEITHSPQSTTWIEGANDAGRTRIERATSLVQSLRDNGVDAELEVVPNIAHDMMGVASVVKEFFRKFLRDLRKEKAA